MVKNFEDFKVQKDQILQYRDQYKISCNYVLHELLSTYVLDEKQNKSVMTQESIDQIFKAGYSEQKIKESLKNENLFEF